MKRVVYLPQGRQVTLANYVRAWKLALTAPEGTIFNLTDRINRRIDGFPGTLRPLSHPNTRKHDYQWQLETHRAALQLNQPRLIIDWLPPWLKTRFAQRLRENLVD
jgi:hypothetical protein